MATQSQNSQNDGMIQVGTRGSPLALAQANDVISRLVAAGRSLPWCRSHGDQHRR